MQPVWLIIRAGISPFTRSGLPVRRARYLVDIYDSSVSSAVDIAFYCACIVLAVSDVEDVAVGVDHLYTADELVTELLTQKRMV